ncbi:MAG: poly-gamma-glutamate biosynthesis protein PgsC [Deltaproteobacteria bacterium]|nr:poly-gamma-glutamate biosynthesis protein PgsC [Deltaproteobacteria bacterium]
MDLLTVSIGIGLVVSLLSTELFGVASAGLVVPGYLALYVRDPGHIAITVTIALATYAVVRLLSTVVVVYGRRRTALMILFGFMLGALTREWLSAWGVLQFSAIGYIIPGLIAIWMDRQGVAQTVASLTIVTGIVRLILIMTLGQELLS